MISEKIRKFCKDDITKIQNYEQAINDKDHVWEIHHRLELNLDGEFAHTASELKRLGMYYHRPYFELILLTKAEHTRLHGKGCSPEARAKQSSTQKGKPKSAEHRAKISSSLTGEKNNMYGKKHSEESRNKMAEAARRYWDKKKGASS